MQLLQKKEERERGESHYTESLKSKSHKSNSKKVTKNHKNKF